MPAALRSAVLFALLGTASLAAQTNLREFGITLRGRPLGSAAPFATLAIVGSPGYGGPSTGQPGHLPFVPVTATTMAPLTPAMEYQLAFRAECVSTADLAPSASLGQRFTIDLSAVFPIAAAMVPSTMAHQHDTAAGYLGLPMHIYQTTGNVLPWQDTSSGASNGHDAAGTTSIQLVPTAIGGVALHLAAMGEGNAVQSFAGAPPSIGMAGYLGQSLVAFVVTQPMVLSLRAASTGEVRGESQSFPLLPVVAPTFVGPSGGWYDPPLALGFDFQQTGSSLFTDIVTLPIGIDGDGLFEVEVGNVSLGWFAQGSRVDFRQILGGNGVASFRIAGIDPAVDATDAAVFPVQLAFDTANAEFTMTPVSWRKVGATCSDAVLCTQCPALELAPNGPAIEGDQNFGFDLQNGPAGGVAALFLGLGTASTAPAPLFCGSVVLPPLPGIFHVGTTALTGTSTCDGSGSVALPLVPVPPLVGLFLTVQAITLCPGGGLGLTHGVEFVIGD